MRADFYLFNFCCHVREQYPFEKLFLKIRIGISEGEIVMVVTIYS